MLRLEYTTRQAKISFPHGEAILNRDGALLRVKLSYQGAYGMGEKYNALNQKGKTVVNRVEEKFCFQGDKTYCSAPFFWTDTGFGLYVDTCEVTTFQFLEHEVLISLPRAADAVIFTGSPAEMIAEYMSLFGPSPLPPEWSFGPWVSANRWNSQKDVEKLLGNLKDYGFPASVVVLEAWSDEATFYIWNGAQYRPGPDGEALRYEDFRFSEPWPDPKGMIRQLHDAGLRLLLWQVPVYKKQGEEEARNEQNDLDREDAVQRGLCVSNADGSPYTIPEGHWFSGSMVPDFTNPATVESWFAKRQYLLDMGVDGFKTDGGEFICADDVRFSDGSTGRDARNRYPRDYTEAYQRFIGPERVLFSRAGYAGQHTVPLHWAGDQQSQNCELESVLRAGLSAAATGMLFWSFDLAGFAGPLPTKDLYRRATQMACFCPIMQWHSEPDGGQFRELLPGGEGNNERSPWNMSEAYGDPAFLDEMRFWYQLREKLRPYLWHTAQNCVRDNKPIMRPLVYDWPDDQNTLSCEDEYLFGDDILVAPYLEENAERRAVYLPQGNWLGLFDGRCYHGPATVTAGSKTRLPVFVRAEAGELVEGLR